MMYKRQSKVYFILQLKESFGTLWGLIPVYLLLDSKFPNHKFWLSMVLIVLLFHFAGVCLRYMNTVFLATDDDIRVKYGSYEVHSINLRGNKGILNYRTEETWLHKIFSVQGLEIRFKNGEEQKAIKFDALLPSDVEKITQRLDVPSEDIDVVEEETVEERESIPEVHITGKQIVVTGLLSANYLIMLPALFAYEKIQGYINDILGWQINPFIYVMIIIGIMPMATIIEQFFNYSEFKIYDEDDRFYIRNGVIDSDGHMIEKANINGVRVDQTFGMRVLGLCSVSVILNDDSDDDTATKDMIFPYVKVTDIDTLMENYLPAYVDVFEPVHLKVTKTKVLYFFAVIALFTAMITLMNLPFWINMILIVIGIFMLMPALTVFKEKAGYLCVRRGLLNIKTHIVSDEKIGVTKQSSILNILHFDHAYTDLKPSIHFKQLR